MEIRRGEKRDMAGISDLLCQVLEIHHEGRPDLFKGNVRKYTDAELEELITDDSRPIFVAAEGDRILGYVFCRLLQRGSNILTDIRSLYIDDLCVDATCRGQEIGRRLYEHAAAYAREQKCYNLTLNVWECNTGARKFYEKCGLTPQKTEMEMIL